VNAYNGFSSSQRMAALRWLNAEYAAGRRVRPSSCDACGQKRGLFEAHSEDYSGPPYGDNIGAFGLCYRCHMMIHTRFKAPDAWEAYIVTLERGGMYPPTGRSWATIQAMLRQVQPSETLLTYATVERWQGGNPTILRQIGAGAFRPAGAHRPAD
jgi:hypothetical protein